MNNLEKLSMAIEFSNNLIADYAQNKTMEISDQVILALYRKFVELSDGIWVNADHELHRPSDL
ncbi:hypothetical protein SRABI84_05389 [Peribacillus simplex]|uniref:hypothetical protein n=1 Tax=Peribacillus simplex TaxID=1478 RepID=UPI001DCBACC5|nr:hypothetical protein [Peribacillus simplex]CAH0323929.1 hypothetical protein SRABI84_05389 [Peribacillus simplex]